MKDEENFKKNEVGVLTLNMTQTAPSSAGKKARCRTI
jgi:hypothetical protein